MSSNSARLALGTQPADEARSIDVASWWSAFNRGGVAASRGRGVRAILVGTALLLLGAVVGLAVGEATARSAHQTGACVALNMAAALGYLDAQQRRQVMHALVTAINPDIDLFPGGQRGMRQACDAGTDGRKPE
jgi:hypothetical protein